jgi:hypothetical protein
MAMLRAEGLNLLRMTGFHWIRPRPKAAVHYMTAVLAIAMSQPEANPS